MAATTTALALLALALLALGIGWAFVEWVLGAPPQDHHD